MRRSRVGSVNEKFSRSFSIDPISGCWNWIGRKNAYGYGLISGEINGKRYARKGVAILAHRVSWIIFKGDIPESESFHGTVVMHICDNRKCVNPNHLRLGTQSDNVKDMVAKGRKVVGEWQKRKGIDHFRSAFKNQSDIDLICATVGKTKELAEKYGVNVCTIKDIRRRNGVFVEDASKFVNKPLSRDAIQHIRSTAPGTRGLGKLYGVSKTTISKIRKGLVHSD